MAKALAFDDPFLPVPAAAIDADPAAAMRELYFRVARLEQSLQEQRVLASAEMAEVLLSQVAIADELAHVVESIGVPTNAQHAMLARGVAALGRRIMEDLRKRGVAPIETLGRPLDPDHSDAVGQEPRAGVEEGTVLQEVRAGYVWRDLVLRRAQVIVCGRAPQTEESPSPAGGAAEGGAR
jgi:molecular chaperone GrpE